MKTQNIDLTLHLSAHFTLGEMVRSGEAIKRGIDNTPTATAVENLKKLCEEVLEPLRRKYGRIIVTSGYRCQELNKAVGGAANSQHTKGEAADIHVTSQEVIRKYAAFIEEHTDYDQLILEPVKARKKRWLHVSYTTRRQNRRMTLGRVEN